MITQGELVKLVNRYQTSEVNTRREYFQHLFLSYFYQQPKTSKVYFKGGTALRIIYKSPRFSEDLDFSTTYKGIHEIEQIIENTLVAIEKENVNVNLSESKQTSGGYLGIVTFDGRISLYLQISLRQEDRKGEVVTVTSDFIPTYIIVALPQDKIVLGKLTALFDRKKPRDFYDLYFMLRANLISPEKRNLLIKAKEILQTANINFAKELKQYLPKSHWILIKDFKKTLGREIGRFTP